MWCSTPSLGFLKAMIEKITPLDFKHDNLEDWGADVTDVFREHGFLNVHDINRTDPISLLMLARNNFHAAWLKTQFDDDLDPETCDFEFTIARFIICSTISTDVKKMLGQFEPYQFCEDYAGCDELPEGMHENLERAYKDSLAQFNLQELARERNKAVRELQGSEERLSEVLREAKEHRQRIKKLNKQIHDLGKKGSQDRAIKMEDSE